MKSVVLILILILLTPLFPQGLNNDQYPPGIKWKKIDTSLFEIVFPEEITGEGQRVANLLEYINPFISETMLNKQKKISLFLSNRGIFSNGYFQMAPRKSEWFSTPPQTMFLGNLEWYSALALHEGRHIVQFEKLNRGFTRAGGFLFGELGRALFTFFSAPQWYFEGDSVYTETAFSGGGRGRVPEFEMSTRALLLSGKRYSYNKSYLSSYKNFTPGIYPLGYFLISHLKRHYPPGTIDKILSYSSKYSFYPLIFYTSIKKATGKSMNEIYNDTMDELQKIWQKQYTEKDLTGFRKINSKKKDSRTLYTYPRFSGNGNIIAQKYSLSNPLTLIELKKNGEEKKIKELKTVDHIYNNLSVSGNLVAWSEPVKDPRWQKRSFAEIVIFDIKTGKTRRITSQSRFFSPALSPDGSKIAAIRFSKRRRSSLVILDTLSGKLLNEINSTDNVLFITPAWDRSGKNIIMVQEKYGRKGLVLFNIENSIKTEIIPPFDENISNPVFFKDYILYGSSYSGINNIYSVNIDSGERFCITSSRFGSFFPEVSPDEKKLIYCEYDHLGMDIVESELNNETWIPVEEINTGGTDYFKTLRNNNILKDITLSENIPEKIYPVKKYNSFKNLLNFHSWIIDPSLPEPSLEIYSNNKLNTTSVTGGFRYNTNEKTSTVFTKAEYGGFFPKFDFEFSHGGRNSGLPDDLKWKETRLRLGIGVPLNLSRGVFNRYLFFSTKFSIERLSFDPGENIMAPGNGYLFSISYRFNYLNYKAFSRRDLQPKWGNYFSAAFTHSPANTEYKGKLLSLRGGAYLPGILKHNHLKLTLAYERQDPLNYIFSSFIPFSRGYEQVFHKKLVSASVDYSFPIAYPDLELGKFLYIKRIKGAIFYDLLTGYNSSAIYNYNSAGIELKADVNLFTLPVNIESGCRFIFRFSDNRIVFEPVFIGISF